MYLQELQDLVLLERLNLKNMIYNLTSNLKDEDLDILYDYANMERRFANTTDEESVKLALASLFSDPGLQGDVEEENETQINVEDIPERVRPILLDKWRRLRSKLDFSKPSAQGAHLKGNTGK